MHLIEKRIKNKRQKEKKKFIYCKLYIEKHSKQLSGFCFVYCKNINDAQIMQNEKVTKINKKKKKLSR
jgi:hypothetical protein